MKIYDFPNELENITLTSEAIENQISKFNFKSARTGTYNEEVENRLRLPTMLIPFYDYVFENQKIPEPELFINKLFAEKYIDWIRQYNNNVDILKGIKYRLWKSYPSFIRDLHFSLLCKENCNHFSKIIYNRKLDVEYGIDILIVYQNLNFAVKLYTSTDNGFKFRQKKDNRHLRIDDVTSVELPINLNSCKSFGDIYLYSKKEMELMMKNINNSIVLQTI